MRQPTVLPVRAFARKAEVARTTLQTWIADGEVPTDSDGNVPVRAGLAAVKKLLATREVAAEDGAEATELRQQLLQARIRERKAIGKLRELELERESGRFVSLAMVQRDGEDAAERIIAVLRSIPQRCALDLECACRPAAVTEQKLSLEVERAIGELHETLYLKPRAT